MLPAQPRTQPSTRPAEALKVHAAALARKVLDDPLNAAAAKELAELRKLQARGLMVAYAELAAGLKVYLDVGPELAVAPLERASQSPRAVSLTATLPRPLDVLLAAARAAARAVLSPKGKACSRCGDTGRDGCRAARCNASGKVPCPRCKGSGVSRRTMPGLRSPAYVICSDCGGLGAARCHDCSGAGVVACSSCKKTPDDDLDHPRVPFHEARAIREVICKARRLGRGGIDLHTPGALKRSPK
jgi:hypothetical protein